MNLIFAVPSLPTIRHHGQITSQSSFFKASPKFVSKSTSLPPSGISISSRQFISHSINNTLFNRRRRLRYIVQSTPSFPLSSSSSSDDSDQIKDSQNTAEDEDTIDPSTVQIDLNLPRRSMLVTFTCNACNGRTERLVNPVAWNKGMVIAQCEQCKVWHKLADAGGYIEEIRYTDDNIENSDIE